MKLNFLRMPPFVSIVFGFLCLTGMAILFSIEGQTTAMGLIRNKEVKDLMILALGYSFNLTEFAAIIIIFSPLSRVIPQTERPIFGSPITIEDVIDVIALTAVGYVYYFNAKTTIEGLTLRGVPPDIANPLGIFATFLVEILAIGGVWGILQGIADLKVLKKNM